MRIWIAFGFVVLLAVIFSSNLIPAGTGAALGVRNSGDWKVACVPVDGCQAWLSLEDGARRESDVNGKFGSLTLRLSMRSDGDRSFIAAFDDNVVPTWEGVRIRTLNVGSRRFPLSCIHRVCAVPGDRVGLLIRSMREGETLVVNPEGRPPVEIAIGDFAPAFDILEKKIADGEDVAVTQAFNARMQDQLAGR